MTQCEYLDRKFKISPQEIKVLKSVELTREIEYTQADAIGSLPQLNIVGYKPQNISLSYEVARVAGVKPYTEYCEWKKILGTGGALYVGDKQFGVDVFTLKKVSLTNVRLLATGDMASGTITLELSQDISAEG